MTRKTLARPSGRRPLSSKRIAKSRIPRAKCGDPDDWTAAAPPTAGRTDRCRMQRHRCRIPRLRQRPGSDTGSGSAWGPNLPKHVAGSRAGRRSSETSTPWSPAELTRHPRRRSHAGRGRIRPDGRASSAVGDQPRRSQSAFRTTSRSPRARSRPLDARRIRTSRQRTEAAEALSPPRLASGQRPGAPA